MLRNLNHVFSNGPDGPVFAVAFHPKSALLATGDAKGTVKLWDLAAGEACTVLRGHRQAVWSVAFSPDGRSLASGSHDGAVKLWDLGTNRERLTLYPDGDSMVWAVAFSPNGRTLAAGSASGVVKLYDAATGQEWAP